MFCFRWLERAGEEQMTLQVRRCCPSHCVLSSFRAGFLRMELVRMKSFTERSVQSHIGVAAIWTMC